MHIFLYHSCTSEYKYQGADELVFHLSGPSSGRRQVCVICCISVWNMSMGCLFVACLRQGIIMSPRLTLNLWWAFCLSLPNARFISIHHCIHHFHWFCGKVDNQEEFSHWTVKDRRQTVESPQMAHLSRSFPSSSQHLDCTVSCRFLSFASQLCLRKGLYFHCYRLKKLLGTLDNKNPCCQETPNCWIYS